MAVLWEMLGNAGNNIYNASRDNADREQRRVASYQQYTSSMAGHANQARSIALEEQKYADQQNQLNSLKEGLRANAGNTEGIIRTLSEHGHVDTAAQVAHTYAQVSKINQEISLKSEGIAMTKAFGALVAAPDEIKDQVYGNIRNYLNSNYNTNLPEELNTGVLMALGNLGAENNSTYQAMLSSTDMMRSIGSGLLESFTSQGQKRTNDVLGAMVGNAQQDADRKHSLEDRKVNVLEGGLDLQRAQFGAERQDRQFDEAIKVAELQQKAAPKPKQYTQSTIQLMEYRDQLEADGASPDQLATIDAAINADITGKAQGSGTNVSIINPETGKISLDGLVAKNIEKQYNDIEEGRKDRVNVQGALQASENLRGTGLETGPGFKSRYAAFKVASFGADSDSVKSQMASNVGTLDRATAQFVQWGMAQQGRGFTDADLKWFETNTISTENPPEVNKVIADSMQRAYDRQDEYQEMLLRSAEEGLSPTQFQKRWKEYEKSLPPIIPPEFKDGVKLTKSSGNSRAQAQQNRLKDLFG